MTVSPKICGKMLQKTVRLDITFNVFLIYNVSVFFPFFIFLKIDVGMEIYNYCKLQKLKGHPKHLDITQQNLLFTVYNLLFLFQ